MSDFSSVPDNWTSKKLAEVVNPHRRITYGIVQPGPRFTPELGVPMIRGQDYSGGEVRVDDLYYVSPRLAASFDRASVRGGDILLSIVGYVGLVAEVPEILSGANLTQTTARIAIQEELHSRFFLHFFRSKAFHSEVKKYMKGSAQPGLNLADVEKMKVIFPERREEQAAISKILDTLDTAIQETEAIVAKLKAVKQGLLHDLLTRGIDANGELRPPQSEAPHLYKPSPLGWIPKEWEVAPLSSYTATEITYGIVQAGPHIPGGVPYIRTGDMSGDALVRESMLCTSRRIANSYARSEVRAGEIVMAIRATVGKVLPVPRDLDGANLTQGTARISPNSKTDGMFLLWAIRHSRVQKAIQLEIKGTTFAEITLGALRQVPVAAPLGLEEQIEIGKRLTVVDERLSLERESLVKWLSQKAGLMDDLLTGRVRVTPLLQEAQHA